ncbi:halo transducer protein [Halorubrum depositum]|uniref:halo transducer protein n=1 Tax=Halorubrum depositum TaxID=2583992 RepID=UPI0011A321D3|nr:halo transducer protein [Halorubrum depositum]
MREESAGDDSTDLDGVSVERAADIVGDEEGEPGELRETLAIVACDGVVRRAAVDDAVADASLVVTTAETRAELAAGKLEGAREAAAPVSDLELVAARVDDFDARLDAVEDRAADLGRAVQEVLAMKEDGDLYEIARRVRRVTNAASEVQRAADDLQFELDSFEEWLADADRRVEELAADVDMLAESVDELDGISEALAGENAAETPASDDADPGGEAARTWAAAGVRHRVASLMIADLRSELAALQTWAERECGTPPSHVGARLDEVQARHEAVGEQLTERAEPEWTARFGDRLAAVEEALGAMEPPVAWGDVEAVVEERGPAVE